MAEDADCWASTEEAAAAAVVAGEEEPAADSESIEAARSIVPARAGDSLY